MNNKKDKVLTQIAYIISRIFGFGTLILFSIVAVYSGKFSTSDYKWILLSVAIFISGGIGLFILSRLGIISDFDLTDRRERPPFLFFMIILGLIVFFLYVIYDVSDLLKFTMIVYLIEMLFNFFITLFWKISNHAIAITSFILLVIILLGISYIYLIFLIPLVGWARLYLKKHTLAQFIAGSFLSFIITVPLAILFGFI